jgi:hypothetical protein
VLVARLAAEEHGVLSIAELRACGLRDVGVFVRVRNGRLHRLQRGVYAVGHPNVTLEGRFLAAVKASGPGALLSHFSAIAHWGMLEWDERWPEVTVIGPGTRLPRAVRVHRTQAVEEADRRRHRGIPVTSPARTLLDAAATLQARGLRRAVRQAQSLRLVSCRELAETLARLPGRRGSRRLAEIVATGPAPTRSELEDVVLDLLLRGGFARPAVNAPLVLSGRRIKPDFRWAAERLVIEADGAAWHDNPIAREDDAERQALLEAHGERVLRVTWAQAVSRPAQTLARIRAAGAPLA